MTVIKEITDYIEQTAPLSLAEAWDNVGLMVGDTSRAVSTVMLALDVTDSVVKQAVKQKAELIISHHPVIFRPLKCLTADSVPYLLAQNGIAVYSAHTNLDKAVGGVNDVLANRLGLTEVRTSLDALSRIGILPHPLSAQAFAAHVAKQLQTAVRVTAQADKNITCVAVCSGSGGDFVPSLWSEQVDAVVTGEISHHGWIDAAENGVVVEAGHFATEKPITAALLSELSGVFPTVRFVDAVETAPYQTMII